MDLTISPSALLLCIAVVTYLVYRWRKHTAESNYPPGPTALPIIGNLHQVALSGGHLVKFLEKYRKIYGNLYTIELGGIKRVVVSGYDVIRELLEKNADYTSNRSTKATSKVMAETRVQRPGLFFANFPDWKMIRSLSMTQLRDEGMGKSSLEPKVLEEFDCYAEHFIKPHLDKAVNLELSLTLATANIISMLLFGRRDDYDDEMLLTFQEYMRSALDAHVKSIILRNIPLINWLPGWCTGVSDERKSADYMIALAEKWVSERKASLDVNNANLFIEKFLVYCQNLEPEHQRNSFTDRNAGAITVEVYIAGTDTTATALRWALLYMCVYQDVQEKVQNEIDTVIGQRPVVYKDRLDLLYTDAVLHEVLRMANIVPTSLPHTCDKDLVVNGVLIPAGAELMLNMYSALYDPTTYEEPHLFRPERFLTGDVALKKSRTIPFSIGRRMCLGKDLARMEIFLFFTSFMQRYRVTYAGETPPSLEGITRIITSPRSYEMIFSTR